MNGHSTSGFAGNMAFDRAHAYVVQQAQPLQENRRNGSIRAVTAAIAAARNDDRVRQTGAADWVVTVTLDRGDFKELSVMNKQDAVLFSHTR